MCAVTAASTWARIKNLRSFTCSELSRGRSTQRNLMYGKDGRVQTNVCTLIHVLLLPIHLFATTSCKRQWATRLLDTQVVKRMLCNQGDKIKKSSLSVFYRAKPVYIQK